MAVITYAGIQTLAQIYLRSDSSDISGNLSLWANLVQLKVAQAARWQFMLASDSLSLTVGAGSGPYTLSQTLVFPAKPGTGYPALEEGRWDQRYLYTAMAAGPPKIFVLVPGQPTQVLIYPAPDQSYTLTFPYYAMPATLSDTSYLVVNFPMILVAGIVWEGMFYLGAIQDLQLWVPRFSMELKALATSNLDAAEAAAFAQTIYTMPQVPQGAAGA